jgi:hypothetical protein
LNSLAFLHKEQLGADLIKTKRSIKEKQTGFPSSERKKEKKKVTRPADNTIPTD